MAESARAVIALFEHVLRLKRLPRTGWLLAGVALPESVADHSYSTALVACVLAEMVNSNMAQEGGVALLDIGHVARIALCHDLAESSVTDLPQEATSYIGVDVKHAAEADAARALLSGVPGGEEMMALWEEYQAGQSPESRLVHDADKLEMVIQARQYASAGNENLDEFFRGHEWRYDETRMIFEQLLSEQSSLR